MARRRRLFGPLFYSTLALALIFLVGLGAWWVRPSLSRVWIMWTLSRRMGDSDSGVRTAAAKALGNYGKEAQSWLGWVGRNGNTEARLAACKTLAHPDQQVSEEIVAALQAAVESPVENLYELMWLDQYLAALRRVAPGSERRAVRSMVEAMDRLGRYEQRIMVDLLGKIGPDAEAAVPKLVELSKSSDDRLAASAELRAR